MFSTFCCLRALDTEANRFYNHEMCAQYVIYDLCPFIDSESNHVRHFIKIPFINKGIDFIDLQSIFQDKSVIQSIPTYFKISEPPIIINQSEILCLISIKRYK